MSSWINLHTHGENQEGVLSIRQIDLLKIQANALYDSGMYSVGLHPWFIKADTLEDDIDVVKKMAANKNIVAIGESGLDRVCDTPMPLQEQAFEMMISLSEILQKPLIIHAVRTHAEIIDWKKKFRPKQYWILHGFNKNFNVAQSFLEQNIILSFGVDVMKEDWQSAQVLQEIPNYKFFLENDDKVKDMKLLYEAAAKIRKVNVEELKLQLFNLFKKVFGYAGT